MLDNIIRKIETSKNSIVDADVSKTIFEMKKASSPVINYEKIKQRNFEWNTPEYNFADIERFADVESLLSQSFRKKMGLFLKEGYTFVGQRPELIDYIKQRLSDIAYVSKVSERQLIENIYYDCDRFSNSYVVKVRDRKASSGYVYKDPRDGQRMEPIAAMFILPAPTAEYKLNDNNHVTKWRQYVKGTKELHREYKVKDIAHFYLNRKKGMINGTPRVIPVLEDIKAYRRIEENVELLVIQNIFPLVHYKVGTDSDPVRMAMDGSGSEIDQVMHQIENMPAEGIYVTSERHEIKMIGTEGRALRVEAYLEHFKKRVLAGLSLSTVDIGEGGTANRSTADTMSRSLVDEVKSDQKSFEEMFRTLVIDELLLEAGEKIDITKEENKVYLRFNEIDYDTEIKKQNHSIQKFLQHGLTHAELRESLGLNPMSEEEFNDSYFKKIEEPRMLVGAAGSPDNAASYASVDNPHTSTSKQNLDKAKKASMEMQKSTAESKASVSVKQNKTTANRNKPQNQHGTKSSSRKSIKDNLINDSEMSDLKSLIASNPNSKTLPVAAGVYGDLAKSRIKLMVRDSFQNGVVSVGLPSYRLTDYEVIRRQEMAISNAEKYVSKLFSEVEYMISSGKEIEDILNRVDSIHYRMSFIEDTESIRAFNWGAISGLTQMGETMYNMEIGDDSDPDEIEAVKHSHLVSKATFQTIPPWHPNSSIRIVRVSNE